MTPRIRRLRDLALTCLCIVACCAVLAAAVSVLVTLWGIADELPAHIEPQS